MHCDPFFAQLNDATFSKFISLYQGDRYIDPLKARLQADAVKRKANVTDTAFKPPAPMKKWVTTWKIMSYSLTCPSH